MVYVTLINTEQNKTGKVAFYVVFWSANYVYKYMNVIPILASNNSKTSFLIFILSTANIWWLHWLPRNVTTADHKCPFDNLVTRTSFLTTRSGSSHGLHFSPVPVVFFAKTIWSLVISRLWNRLGRIFKRENGMGRFRQYELFCVHPA